MVMGDIGSKGRRCFNEPKKGIGRKSSALSGEMSDKYGRGVVAGDIHRERYLILIFLENFFFLSWSEKRGRGRKLVSLLTDDT
jgi:hypothetical protein